MTPECAQLEKIAFYIIEIMFISINIATSDARVKVSVTCEGQSTAGCELE